MASPLCVRFLLLAILASAAQGPCPDCGANNRLFFGDILARAAASKSITSASARGKKLRSASASREKKKEKAVDFQTVAKILFGKSARPSDHRAETFDH